VTAERKNLDFLMVSGENQNLATSQSGIMNQSKSNEQLPNKYKTFIENDAQDAPDSDSSLSSITDYSDLDPEQLENIRQRKQNKKISWENLTFWDKTALFNKWSLLSIIGNLCTFFGSMCYIVPKGYNLQTTELLIGIGCGLNWISVTRYFTHSRQYSLITRTLQKAVPTNIKLMIGILPIFIGYTLFCLSLFWAYRSHLSNSSDAGYMLFCMMNGDSILNTFQAVT